MPLRIEDIARSEIDRCARIACESEIGRRYGFERETLAGRMREALASGSIIIAARETGAAKDGDANGGSAEGGAGDILGFAWIDPRGAFGSAPYLKLLAVDGEKRGAGVGRVLMAEFERRTAGVGRVWTLMVSDFNARAITFYEKLGYSRIGAIPGFAREGIAELLMVKKKP